MNNQIQHDQISIADQLLKQLEDQYMAVVGQNIAIPKQNIQPQDDPQNPYQPLDFDDQDEDQFDQYNFDENKPQQTTQNQANQEPKHQQHAQDIMEQIKKMRISQTQSNPEIKQLIEVPPTNDSIYASLPHKQFSIDQDKIKSFALSMDIDEPEWLKDQTQCKARIQQLFIKKSTKPFTKI